jgi:hypothetical protein
VVKCTVQTDELEAEEVITALATAGYAVGASIQED